MTKFESPSPAPPPDSSSWRRYLDGLKKRFFSHFDSQGDWLVFGLVALAVLWLSARVLGLLRKLLGW
ncbi:hypothetical protein [Methylocapsa acidiphila]|uniref:hypothetical protein n=1 Tax=Methylocapsa acidiphila TaxID=133552 RepID=UPI0003F58F9F|nr:hypothetical protein [Methylocapsa acidiphila]